MKKKLGQLGILFLVCMHWQVVAAGEKSSQISDTLKAQASQAKRIVSIGGVTTEILYALGIGDKIVAVDTTSTYPLRATQLPKVGYHRRLTIEGILSTKPDLLVLTETAGPQQVIDGLKKMGVPILKVHFGFDVASLNQGIQSLGVAFTLESQARALRTQLEQDQAKAGISEKIKTGCSLVVFKRGQQWMAAGQKTAPNTLLGVAKMKNCVSHEGFKTISIESMIKLQPTKMLLTEHSIAGYQSIKRFKQDPQLRLLPAVKQGHIYLFDALEIFSIGPRSLQAISQWPQRKLDDQYQIDPNKKVS